MKQNKDTIHLKSIRNYSNSQQSGELSIKNGDKLIFIENSPIYIKVMNANGETGFVPLNCIDGKPTDEKENPIFMVHHVYKSKSGDEMSIQVGDILKVLAVASDGWCYANKGSNFGWVPCNHLSNISNNFQMKDSCQNSYVRSLVEETESKVKQRASYKPKNSGNLIKIWEGYEWYYNDVTVKQCQLMLIVHGQVGDFLVRMRDDNSSLCLMTLTKEGVHSFPILIIDEKFVLGDVAETSLRKLLDHYVMFPLSFCSDHSPVTILQPIKRMP